MKRQLTCQLSRSAPGRIALHLAALLAGGRSAWHWAGIRRELRPAPAPRRNA